MAAKFPITNSFLNVYGAQVVAEQKTRLNSFGKGGGPLEESLSYKPFNNGTNFGVNFYGNEYTEYVDKGVQGADTGKTKTGIKSKFKYTNKMPPTKAILPWVKKKKPVFRSAKGRFLKQTTIAFLIARSIFKRGSETTNFFTIPIARSEKRFVENLERALAQDIENNLNNDLK